MLEAIERGGATPHVLVPRRLSPEDVREARDEAALRGWQLEDLPYPPGSLATRIRQHARQEMQRQSPLLAARIAELARTAAFTQFEEIGAMGYTMYAPRQVPVVVSAHNVYSVVEAAIGRQLHDRREQIRGRYWARRVLTTERRAARRADVVVCVTSHDGDHFKCNGAARSLVIPNGVDEELFALSDEPAHEPRVLFFGSHLWPPNAAGLTRYLHEVWPRVVRELPSAELRVAGPGSVDAIREAASQTRRVTILGFVPDLRTELETARVVVAPIWFGGGTRIKVLEALAAARPVVGTTVGVERIGFEHGQHGLVADDPKEMAAATLLVLVDDEAARRYARKARALADSYRWRTVTAPLVELYRTFVERRYGVTI